ncbi:MAG: ClpX C4-type zinc finger protein [Bryobacteraceae bacterium]
MRHASGSGCDSLRCSFCHKAQGDVRKLISNPGEYPRAYICDECVGVCMTIIEDDREDTSELLLALGRAAEVLFRNVSEFFHGSFRTLDSMSGQTGRCK